MTAILAMLRRMHAEVDDGEGIVNEGLPSGSERYLMNIISKEVLRTGK